MWQLALAIACTGCAEAARTPGYQWPQALVYRLDYVSQANRDTTPVMHYAEQRTIQLTPRGDYFLLLQGGLLKSVQDSAGVRVVPLQPEDTLGFAVRLGTHGELSGVQPSCDPALAACREALSSVVLLELRRVLPRLPPAGFDSGATWVDTIRFDEAAKLRGSRGAVITTYAAGGDSVIAGRAYRVVNWRAMRQVWQRTRGAALPAEAAVGEMGLTLIDRELNLPAFSTWLGMVPASAEIRAAGATATGFRGRAYLAGSRFDSLYSRDLTP